MLAFSNSPNNQISLKPEEELNKKLLEAQITYKDDKTISTQDFATAIAIALG